MILNLRQLLYLLSGDNILVPLHMWLREIVVKLEKIHKCFFQDWSSWNHKNQEYKNRLQYSCKTSCIKSFNLSNMIPPGYRFEFGLIFQKNLLLVFWNENLNHLFYISFTGLNSIQDGLFRSCSRIGGTKSPLFPPSLIFVTHFLQWWNLTGLYLT